MFRVGFVSNGEKNAHTHPHPEQEQSYKTIALKFGGGRGVAYNWWIGVWIICPSTSTYCIILIFGLLIINFNIGFDIRVDDHDVY